MKTKVKILNVAKGDGFYDVKETLIGKTGTTDRAIPKGGWYNGNIDFNKSFTLYEEENEVNDLYFYRVKLKVL